MTLTKIIDAAIATLSSRQQYAASTIRGFQLWSGADLKGNAKRYGRSYQGQRAKAYRAVKAAGGVVIPTEHGRLRTARIVGTDDYGNLIAETTKGFAIAGRTNWQHFA